MSRTDRRRPPRGSQVSVPARYWADVPERLLMALGSTRDGLSSIVADSRRGRREPRRESPVVELLLALARQLASPLVLILVFAAVVAAGVGDWLDAEIVLTIVLVTAAFGAWHERRAAAAVAQLRERIRARTTVLRDGRPQTVPSDDVVPGDVALLEAGGLVPGDGVVLEATDCFVTQAALTGESLPVEKQPGVVAAEAALAERTNTVFLGTSVRSGTARVLIVAVDDATEYGAISERLRLRPPETDFERGVREYGYFLTRVMTVLVVVVFAANVLLDRPAVDSLLFAIALAVGISPELLPAVISVLLARGAREMAQHGVIVRRLNSIENFGSMDVLCADKTGTLTEGAAVLERVVDTAGHDSNVVLEMAALNAHFETGLSNPLDDAILARAGEAQLSLDAYIKVDEVPYDFERKRLSVVVAPVKTPDRCTMTTKGAFYEVLAVCDRVRVADGRPEPLLHEARGVLEREFAAWCASGYRVLAVATKESARQTRFARGDERALVLEGFLLFRDPPKRGIEATLLALAALGVQLKIITGDNRFVARHVAEAVGLGATTVVTGGELNRLGAEAWRGTVERAQVFAEVDPAQKERIVAALKGAGHVVGFLGDGINDAPALHAADVGISVDRAVDVAKEAADLVLMENDLDVLRRGVELGRTTFENTLKYVAITTSANFGNMLSMAGASLLLPFLPLLAKQILLNNLLSDVPGMAIAGDTVDAEVQRLPRRWSSSAIRRSMFAFGGVSSAFDVLTFVVLLYVFEAGAEVFRTGWFVESLLTELAIVFVLRTRRPVFRSLPGRWLCIATASVVVLAVALPYVDIGAYFGFVPLPFEVLAALLGVTLAYVLASEAVKLHLGSRALGARLAAQ